MSRGSTNLQMGEPFLPFWSLYERRDLPVPVHNGKFIPIDTYENDCWSVFLLGLCRNQ